MSLRVWLPLNGTLDNQGLDDIVVTSNGATIDNSGKIGKCYSFDGSDDYISLTGNCLYNIIKGGTNSFSIGFWIYQADSTRAIIFGDYGLAGGIGFNIELTTSHCVRFYWNGSPDLGISQINVGTTTWNHVVLVYNTTHLYGYLNGNLVYTYTGTLTAKNKTSGSYYLGRDSRTASTALNGKINDFRIYDHALSSFEIKQISQGLILHYPLNNNGWGQENLHKNSDTITSTWSINQGTVSNGIVTITPSNGSDRRIYQMPANGGWSWKSNKTYTASIDARSPNGAILIFYPYGAGSMNKSYTVTSQWKRYSFTFTATQSGTSSMTYHVNQTSGVTLQLKHPKLELGQKATPWCPNEADELYNQLGLNNNIQYDTSGYCNNGVKTGNFQYDNDTPKYNVSAIFNGADNCIQIGNLYSIFLNPFSINLWFKKEAIGSKKYETLIGGASGFEMDTRNGASQTLSLYMTSTRGGNVYSSFEFNNWYMVTMVNNGTHELYYINGILIKTIEKKNMPNSNYYIGAWNTPTQQNFKGNMSDIRIYCTALSAEDILSLYNNSAYIDNQGNIYGAVYEEV